MGVRDTYHSTGACGCRYQPNFTGKFCYNLGILLASCPRADSSLCINSSAKVFQVTRSLVSQVSTRYTLQIARRLAGIVCFFSCCGVSGGNMSDFIPKVLIFGHSFVRRLHDDLVKGFDSRAKQNFNLIWHLRLFKRHRRSHSRKSEEI